MDQVCFNGQFIPAWQGILQTRNRSFKWGDGLFETIRVHQGKILLQNLHFERLKNSLNILKYKFAASEDEIADQIIQTCTNNHCLESAKVRLALWRLDSHEAGWLIEAIPLANSVKEQGISIDIYPEARKGRDVFSNLKTANLLPYVMAALFAKENNLDDALVLNDQENICDSSKANLFLVTKNEIHTPALNQGCIAGVMRRYLLEEFSSGKILVKEKSVSVDDLLEADEIFLTNSIIGIRPVRQFRNKTYGSSFTEDVKKKMLPTFY
jgi:branched-chain amino acid aminotransferase